MPGENVWYHRQSSQLESMIIDHFQKEGIWDTVVWSNNEYERKVSGVEPDIKEYRSHVYKGIPKDTYDYLHEHLFTYIDMYSRWSTINASNYDERSIHDYISIFNMTIDYTYHKLIDEKINLVIFNRDPHLGGDLILCLLAEIMGIRILYLEQSIFPNLFFHCFDRRDFGAFKTSKIMREYQLTHIERSYPKSLWYMKNKSLSALRVDQRLYNSFKDEYRLLKELFSRGTYGQALYRYSLKKRYKLNGRLIAKEKFDRDCNYVYFPLHLQPEKTTSAWGGQYVDQLYAIERLSDLIPEEWKIYVKENPKQSYFMRGNYFFERLGKIRNVELLSRNVNTYDLIGSSRFVATVTGTVGWEAITGGKNVLVFGWGTWYKSLPGVFTYSSDVDLHSILNHTIDHSELEREYSKLLMKMGKGIVYQGYRDNYPEYDEKINSELVIDAIKIILYSGSALS